MSVLLLRSFLEVYRQGSVSSASRKLGLTQPAVSGHVTSLEASLGRKLFVRHSRGVRPTAIAHDLAQRVGDALDTAESVLAEVRARSKIAEGMIHLCGPSDLLSDLIVDQTASLIADGMTVQFHPARAEEMLSILTEGRADFAFALRPPADPNLDVVLFGAEELVLVFPASAIRSDAKDITSLLQSLQPIAYDLDRYLVETWLQHNRLEIKIAKTALIAPDLRAMRNFVVKGVGWTVLPRYMVAETLAAGSVVEISGPIGNPLAEYYLIWSKGSLRNPRSARAKKLLLATADLD